MFSQPDLLRGRGLVALAGPRRVSAQPERGGAVRHGAGRRVAVRRVLDRGGGGDPVWLFLFGGGSRLAAHGRPWAPSWAACWAISTIASACRGSIGGNSTRAAPASPCMRCGTSSCWRGAGTPTGEPRRVAELQRRRFAAGVRRRRRWSLLSLRPPGEPTIQRTSRRTDERETRPIARLAVQLIDEHCKSDFGFPQSQRTVHRQNASLVMTLP